METKKAGVVAFAFGSGTAITPNWRIAQIASQKAREFDSRVYTQLDIRVEKGIPVEYTEEDPGSPPPTLRIARGAIQWAKRYKITELWVVAAEPHLWRALRDVQRAAHEDGARIEVHGCKEIEQYPEDSWFCLDSVQNQAQSRDAWKMRELILRFTPFSIYKMIAS